jgi:hypothetical protein
MHFGLCDGEKLRRTLEERCHTRVVATGVGGALSFTTNISGAVIATNSIASVADILRDVDGLTGNVFVDLTSFATIVTLYKFLFVSGRPQVSDERFNLLLRGV